MINYQKKSSTAKAISYALNNQNALMKFLDNGKIEIDNNAAERAMRSIAIGRKIGFLLDQTMVVILPLLSIPLSKLLN